MSDDLGFFASLMEYVPGSHHYRERIHREQEAEQAAQRIYEERVKAEKESEKLIEQRFREMMKAFNAYAKRHDAEHAAYPLPEVRFRIRNYTEFDKWFVEKAVVARDDNVMHFIKKDGEFIRIRTGNFSHLCHEFEANFDESLTPKDFEEAVFEFKIVWRIIGPVHRKIDYRHGYGGHQAYEREEVLGFEIYDDAEKWLRAYLKPVASEVYFTEEMVKSPPMLKGPDENSV